MSKNKKLLFFALTVAVALAFWTKSVVAAEGGDYNIVLIVADALRYDSLGCYGGEAETPNLDNLAKNGVIFNRAYASAPWTAPSSVSMFTGDNPNTFAQKPFKETVQINVPDERKLISELLQQKGYFVVNNIENWNAVIHNNFQGFRSLGGRAAVGGLELNLASIESKTGIYDEGMYRNMYPFLDFLLSVDDQKSFMAVQWFMDPHAPYKPNSKFRKKIRVNGESLPAGVAYIKPNRQKGQPKYTKQQNIINKKLYLAAIESVDERVGFIMEALKQRHLLGKTLIIFTSDHGEEFGEHGRWGHGGFGKHCSYFDTLTRVPLLMSGPGVPKGKTIGEIVSLVDLMPTLSEYLHIYSGSLMQGVSFLPLINAEKGGRRYAYLSNVIENGQVDAVVTGKYKLIALRNGNFELYNLIEDKKEKHDVVNNRPEKVRELKKLLIRVRRENLVKLAGRSGSSSGYKPKSKREKKAIVQQLKSLGYIR